MYGRAVGTNFGASNVIRTDNTNCYSKAEIIIRVCVFLYLEMCFLPILNITLLALVSNLPACGKKCFCHVTCLKNKKVLRLRITMWNNGRMCVKPTDRDHHSCQFKKWRVESFWISVNKWKNIKQGFSNLQNMQGPNEVSLDHDQPEGTPNFFPPAS